MRTRPASARGSAPTPSRLTSFESYRRRAALVAAVRHRSRLRCRQVRRGFTIGPRSTQSDATQIVARNARIPSVIVWTQRECVTLFAVKPPNYEWSGGHSAAAGRPSTAARALTGHITIPAKNGPIAARLERHGRGLSATGTNHRSSLRRRRAVTAAAPATPLIGFLGLAAWFAAFWRRKPSLRKNCLIGSAECKFLPTVTAN